MSRSTGIWIDHARAMIVMFGEGAPVVDEVTSNAESHHKSIGSSGVRPPGHLKGAAIDRYERRRTAELKGYYTNVIRRCAGSKAIVVIGPGLAKRELVKQWRARTTPPPIVAVETADHLTQRQIVAQARKMLAEQAAKPTRRTTGKRLRHVRPGRKNVTARAAE